MHDRSGVNDPAPLPIGYGGAMVSPETYRSVTGKKMIGSAMIFEAENIDVVRKLIYEDIYYTSGVVCFVYVVTKSLI
jgi:hypothetical protein